MTDLPTGWRSVLLGDLILPVAKADPVELGRENIRYIDIGSVDGIRHEIVDVREIPAVGAPSRARQIVLEGDTVFSTVRPYLEKIAFVDGKFDGEFASTGFCVLRPNSRLVPKYLFYFAISHLMLDQVLPKQKGVSYPAVLDRQVKETVVPIPPLEEQRRIVEVLEDHLSRIDAAEVSLLSADRRLALLQEKTVVGNLGASGGLEQIVDGLLPILEEGWRWRTLGDLAQVVGGVTKDAQKESSVGYVEVPYLRVANVQRGRLDLSEILTIRVPEKKAIRLNLMAGDVLMNEGGDRDKLARGWVWEDQIENCIHQNHVFRARPGDEVRPEWLAWCSNTYGARWAQRHGRQSVNLASISLGTIKTMPIPVPSLRTQDERLSVIREAVAAISRLRIAITRARGRSSTLRKSLLAAAFSGRLTGSSSEIDRAMEASATDLEAIAQ